MSAAIASVNNIGEGNEFLILGDMMEFGSDEVLCHKELIYGIQKSKPDKLILCGFRI